MGRRLEMLAEPPGPKAVAEFENGAAWWKLRDAIRPRLASKSGPQPEPGAEKDWREEMSFWKKAAVTRSRCTTPSAATTTSAWPAGG